MKLNLWEQNIPYFSADADTPNSMNLLLIDTDKPLPCVVVLPGGGYYLRSDHEGAPVAEFFNSKGYHAAVVDYRVAPNRHPAPLADVQRAIRILRANAEMWRIDPEKIIILGFSAGGHLAASSIVFGETYTNDCPTETVDIFPCRPNGAILCYPVISVEQDYGHVGSGKNLLGEERYAREAESFDLAGHVTESTPKVFLWHTSADQTVNVKNSLIFAECLRNHSIPFELHIYPHGRHGLGLASAYPDVSGWASLAADWIKREFS